MIFWAFFIIRGIIIIYNDGTSEIEKFRYSIVMTFHQSIMIIIVWSRLFIHFPYGANLFQNISSAKHSGYCFVLLFRGAYRKKFSKQANIINGLGHLNHQIECCLRNQLYFDHVIAVLCRIHLFSTKQKH